MSSQPTQGHGRVSKGKIDQLNKKNPTSYNRFEALSDGFTATGGRNLVQQKLFVLSSKRSFDQVDEGGPSSSPKRVAAPSYAQKVSGNGGGGATTMLKSGTVNVNPVSHQFVTNPPPLEPSVSPEPNVSLGLGEEMQNLTDFLEKDSSPLNMALLLYLNKLNESFDEQRKKIISLERDVAELQEKCRQKELFVNKACVDKERSALRLSIDNSLKTLRIAGIEREKKTNKEVLGQTVAKLMEGSADSDIDFSNTKIHTAKDGKVSTLNITCHSLEQKLRAENRGRKAGLNFRQQLPAQLVGTFKDIREAYKKVDTFKDGHLMVKLCINRISISHRQDFGSKWSFVENLPLPASKKMLSLGCQQSLSSRIADLTKVSLPDKFC